MIKILCPVSHTVWGPLTNRQQLDSAIAKSGQPFGVDWSGPACDFRKDWPCDKTFYQMLGIQAHNGIDLPCSSGMEVFAPHDGTISEISNDTASGLGVVLFDPVQRIKTILWHFLTNYKKVGDKVKCGDLIGLSDNTGYSKGPHLHWGLKLTDESGNSLDKENGYLGAIDPLSVDIFFNIIDNMLQDKLVRANKDVYRLARGEKDLFLNGESFVTLDGRWDKIVPISQSELDAIPDGFVLIAVKQE